MNVKNYNYDFKSKRKKSYDDKLSKNKKFAGNS